jgi:hypothetical protein
MDRHRATLTLLADLVSRAQHRLQATLAALAVGGLLLAPAATRAQDTAGVLAAAAEASVGHFGNPDQVQFRIDPRVWVTSYAVVKEASQRRVHAAAELAAAARAARAVVTDVAFAERCFGVAHASCWPPTPHGFGFIALSVPVISGDTATVVVATRYMNAAASGTRTSIRSSGSEHRLTLVRTGGSWRVIASRALRVT